MPPDSRMSPAIHNHLLTVSDFAELKLIYCLNVHRHLFKQGNILTSDKRRAVYLFHCIQVLIRKTNLAFLESTSSAEGRSLGSKARRRSSKRRAIGSAFLNFSKNDTGVFFLMLLRYLLAFSFRICTYLRNIDTYYHQKLERI